MTIFHIIFFGFIIIVRFSNGSAKNLVSSPGGFAPFGVTGVVNGAAIVYFSYIGYDSVSTLAEEIKTPLKNFPVGIVGSVLVVSSLYCLIAIVLCVMVPYNEISDKASFAMAFQRMGWKWASHLVGAGASLGIVASLLVAMLGQARYLCVIARARLVLVWLAKVHPSTGTHLNVTLFLGLCTSSIALFTELDIVLEIISIGTLLVFYMVANALIYRRYVITSCNNPPLHTLIFLFLLTATSIGFSLSWKLEQRRWGVPTIWCIVYNHNHDISVHDVFNPTAARVRLVCASNAMACCRVRLFERFPDDDIEDYFVCKIWYMDMLYSFVLCTIWCSLHLPS